MRAHLDTGRLGEDLAAEWYRQHGYEVVDRNWRCAQGEIDLILGSGSTLVISEVKTRRSRRFGSPALAVTATKQRRLRRLAVAWLGDRRATGERRWKRRFDLRFDVVAVTIVGGERTVDVFTNAF